MYTIIPLSISIRYTLSVKTIYTKPPVTPVKRSYTDSSLDETINPHPNPNFYQTGYESLFFKEIGRKIRGTRLCTRKPPRYGAHQIDTNKNPSPFTQNKRRGGMRNAQCDAHVKYRWNQFPSSLRQRKRSTEMLGWRASARHVARRHPVAYPRICLGRCFLPPACRDGPTY